jgi:hypothetical protein
MEILDGNDGEAFDQRSDEPVNGIPMQVPQCPFEQAPDRCAIQNVWPDVDI